MAGFFEEFAFLDWKMVNVKTAACVMNVSVDALLAALAWDDHVPNANMEVLLGAARAAAARCPQLPKVDDEHERMSRMRFER